MIKIVIMGSPVPKKSTKFFFRKGKCGARNTQADFMNSVKWQIKEQYPYPPLPGNVEVLTLLYFPIPKSLSKKKIATLKEENTYCDKKADVDNCEKLYFDCLKDIVFEDDRKIVNNNTLKIWSADPRIEFYIKDLSEEKADPQSLIENF